MCVHGRVGAPCISVFILGGLGHVFWLAEYVRFIQFVSESSGRLERGKRMGEWGEVNLRILVRDTEKGVCQTYTNRHKETRDGGILVLQSVSTIAVYTTFPIMPYLFLLCFHPIVVGVKWLGKRHNCFSYCEHYSLLYTLHKGNIAAYFLCFDTRCAKSLCVRQSDEMNQWGF